MSMSPATVLAETPGQEVEDASEEQDHKAEQKPVHEMEQEERAAENQQDQDEMEVDDAPTQGEETTAEEDDHDPIIYLEEEQLEFDNPVLILNGRIMVPVRSLAESLGSIVDWEEETQEVIITSSLEEEIVFQPDNPLLELNGVVYRMDISPVIVDSSIYVPLRHAAEFMHTEVIWDEASMTADLIPIEPHIVQEEDSLESISDSFGIEPDLLVERNQLEEAAVQDGDVLKIFIPDIMRNKITEPPEAEPALTTEAKTYTEEEFILLAKITMVEAGYESYEGQLAVANVILNRVADPRFPDTIREVIYAPNQFPPAYNGMLDAVEPSESVLKATEAALNGENNVEGALYFHNPKVTSDDFWNRLTVVDTIGNHRFLK